MYSKSFWFFISNKILSINFKGCSEFFLTSASLIYSLYLAYNALTNIANKITPNKYSIIDNQYGNPFFKVKLFCPANAAIEIDKLLQIISTPLQSDSLFSGIEDSFESIATNFIIENINVFRSTINPDVLISLKGLYPYPAQKSNKKLINLSIPFSVL